MTAAGGEWAEASVGVTLNWDNVEGELRERLEKSSRQAAIAVRKNFAQLETSSRKSFDRMATSFVTQMGKIEREGTRTATAVSRSWASSMARMVRVTELATGRITAALRDIPNVVPVAINISQTGVEQAELRRLTRSLQQLQAVGDVYSNVMITTSGANATDLAALATALRKIGKAESQNIVISVTVHGLAEVERLALALAALPNNTNVDVNANTNQTSKMAKLLGKGAGLLGGLTGLASGALSAGASMAKLGAMAGTAVVAIAGALPAVAGLAAALGSVLVAGAGAAVAGLAAVALAGATLKVAFSGFGEVMKNALDPDSADAFAAALAKLSPEAQQAALSMQSVGKQFKDIVKMPVQDSFFSGLGPKIQQLDQFLVPLRDSMMTVADGFNEGAKSALNFVNSAQGVSMVQSLLGESGNMAANLGSALGNLVPGLLAVMTGASQTFGPMTDGLAGAARGLSEFLVKAQESGAMQQFFTSAVAIAKQLGAVLADVGGIISGVFSAAQAGGGNIMGTLGQALDAVNKFVNSVEGQEALTSFFTAMSSAVGAVLPILMQVAGIIGGQVAPMIAQVITTIAPVAEQLVSMIGLGIAALGPAIGPLAQAIGEIGMALGPIMPVLGELIATFVRLAGPILSMLAEALQPIILAIGGALIKALDALMPIMEPIGTLFEALSPIIAQIATILGDVLAEAITALMPIVMTIATAFGQVLTALQPLLPILGDALIQIIQTIAPLIETQAGIWMELVQAILPLLPPLIKIVANLLPPLIELIGALLPILMLTSQMFLKLVTVLMPVIVWLANLIVKFSEVLATIINFVTLVVTKITEFVGNVVGKFGELASGISDKVGEAKDWVVEKFDAMVAFVTELPGRITTAASGMWDGIKESFKAALNWIIQKWNDFSISVDIPDAIPGLPDEFKFETPNIPLLASGGAIGRRSAPGAGRARESIEPGGFIVNARAAARNASMLSTIAPGGRFLRGPGSGTSDSIAGVHNGRQIAAVSNREYYVPPGQAALAGPLLAAINAGRRVAALAGGGKVADDLRTSASGVLSSGYTWGGWGDGWNTDCSGVVSALVNMATGAANGPGEGERSATGGFGSWLPAMGLQPGLGNPGDLQVAWSDSHAAATLPSGENVEHSGPQGAPGKFGASATGADDASLPEKMHLPMGGDPSGDSSSAPSLGGSSSSSGGGSTPIGSGLGGGSSWGNSGGGSKFNSSAEAERGGVTPVWVENWPATIGSGSGDLGGTAVPADAGLTGESSAPAPTTDTIELVQNPDGTYSAVDPEWDKLIKRESGGRVDVVQGVQDVNSGGNEASGLFQIAKGTWASNGGTNFAPTAGEATAEQQAEIAAKIFNEQGGSPWGSGAGQNFGRENEEALRAGIRRAGTAVPVTAQGTVPVTVTDSAPAGTTMPAESSAAPATSTSAAAAPTGYEAMPYGVDRANAWAGTQDFAGQARDWGVSAITGELGAFLEPVGADGLMKRAVDELIKWAQSQREAAPATVKYADTVNNYGMDPNQTKTKAVEGMTAVTETYRQG